MNGECKDSRLDESRKVMQAYSSGVEADVEDVGCCDSRLKPIRGDGRARR